MVVQASAKVTTECEYKSYVVYWIVLFLMNYSAR